MKIATLTGADWPYNSKKSRRAAACFFIDYCLTQIIVTRVITFSNIAFSRSTQTGYGNISPTNTFGRMFMIMYAIIGIPVNGILFAYLGEFFGSTVVIGDNDKMCYFKNTIFLFCSLLICIEDTGLTKKILTQIINHSNSISLHK